MPFEGINFGLLRPTVALKDPAELQMQALGMQQAQMQLAKQRQEIQDAADFRAKYGVSPGMAQAQQKLALGGLETQKAQHDAATAHLQAVSALNQQQLSTYQSALDALDKDPTQAPAIHASVLQKTAQNAKTLFPEIDTTKTDDPQAFQSVDQQKAWLQSKISQSMTAEQRFKQAEQQIEQAKLKAPKGDIANFAASIGLPVDDPRTVKLWNQYHPKASTNVSLGGALGGAAAIEDPTSALSKLSPNDQALVKQLAERKIMVGRAGGFQLNKPENKALYALAVRLNPSLSVVDNSAYQNFTNDLAKSTPNSAGGRVDAGNRMLGHAADLIDALNKLKPGSGTLGRIGNLAAYPLERLSGAEIGPVSFIKSKLMAEVNKLVTGGVPHAQELMDDIKNLPDTATREQWGSLIKAVADVGLEQVTATEEKRNNFFGSLNPHTSLLSKKAQANLAKIYKYAGVEPPALSSPSGQGYTKSTIEGNQSPTTSSDDLLKLFGK